MWIDVPATPQAVVLCVIIFNAAFGYSWGPIPWLYPPEVSMRWNINRTIDDRKIPDYASDGPCKRSINIYSHELGI